MRRWQVTAGQTVIEQGAKGEFFYAAEEGTFDVVVNGKAVHMYTASAAEKKYPCFGELALMYSKPRAASVVSKVGEGQYV